MPKLPKETLQFHTPIIRTGINPLNQASNSFVSDTRVNLVGGQILKTSMRQISTLMGTTTTKMSLYDLKLNAVKGGFSLRTRATMIKKRELLMLDNPYTKQ